MKKLLLFVLILASTSIYAQHQTVFDFSIPSSLQTIDGSVIAAPVGGGSVNITDKVLIQDGIKVSFSKGTGVSGIQIKTDADGSFLFSVGSGAYVIFESLEGRALTSIVLGGANPIGDWRLGSGEPGIIPDDDIMKRWSNDGQVVTRVLFTNSYVETRAKRMVVTHTDPLPPLEAAVFPSTEETQESLKSISLTFNSPIREMDNHEPITLTGNGQNQVLTPSIEENVASLTMSSTLTTQGFYVISIPGSTFCSLATGATNQAMELRYEVKVVRDDFCYESIDPEEGEEMVFPISLTFPNQVGKVEKFGYRIYSGIKDDELDDSKFKAVLNASIDEEDSKVVRLYNDTNTEFEEGNYFLVIDAKSIYNNAIIDGELDPVAGRWNPEYKINFIVSGPNTQLKQAKVEAETLIALTEKATIGYPSTESEVNTKLIELLTDEDATLEDYKTALKNFYEYPVVELPKADQWYTIFSVNSEKHTLPLSYDGDAVKVGGEASAFKVNSIEEKTIVLETEDGKFLHVLMATDDYDYTSKKNVTTETKYIRKLILDKFLLEGSESQKPLAGMLTIRGGMGNDSDGEKVGDAYALVSHPTGEILTSLDEANNLYFDVDKSSAFAFVPADDPALNKITPMATLDTGELYSNVQKMIMTIDSSVESKLIEHVTVKDGTLPYFIFVNADEANDVVVDTFVGETIVQKMEGAEIDNQFLINVNGLDYGNYCLVMPEGTFDYSGNEFKVKDSELRVEFQIKQEEQPIESQFGGLTMDWGFLPRMVLGDPVKDSDLLDIMLYMNQDIYPSMDEAKNIVTVYGSMGLRFVAQGHFESVTMDGRNMLRIVYNEATPLKLPLAKGDYSFIVDKAAFGDDKFHRYQTEIKMYGSSTIQPQDCKVNNYFVHYATVNNEEVDGISNIKTNSSNSSIFYDLQGRRVQKMDKKGVYIVNGRKVVKR